MGDFFLVTFILFEFVALLESHFPWICHTGGHLLPVFTLTTPGEWDTPHSVIFTVYSPQVCQWG